MNKLHIAVEKIKKQMSANSNKLPFQIDSLVDDIDVSVSVDRATFEGLISDPLREVRQTLEGLLHSTKVRKGSLYSVEIAQHFPQY